MAIESLKKELNALGSPHQARHAQRFFKTGKGEYGEGDRFIGVRMPQIRAVAKKYRSLSLTNVRRLLRSPVHEERMTALLIWVFQYEKGDIVAREKIFHSYLSSTRYINNWDLVDLSAPTIVGNHLLKGSKQLLKDLSASHDLWERRIAVLATFPMIRSGDFAPTLLVSRRLLKDPHDLIHKATGWMLREVGKRDLPCLEEFLKKHYLKMPRTMLRYAIEKLPKKQRKAYLSGKVV